MSEVNPGYWRNYSAVSSNSETVADAETARRVQTGRASERRNGVHVRKRAMQDVRILDLPRIGDPNGRGNLTFLEGEQHIPFPIKRVYYLYDVPGGESRGGHAHKALQQFIVAVSGSFEVHLDDGYEKKTISLNRSYYGLLLPRMVWRELHNFSSGSVCLVMASEIYDPGDYIYEYGDFLKAATSE